MPAWEALLSDASHLSGEEHRESEGSAAQKAPRSSRWRWRLLSVALVVLVLLLLRGQLADGDRVAHDAGGGGPLRADPSRTIVGIAAVELGLPVTMGQLVVVNTGDKPAILEAIRTAPLPEGLVLVGVVTAQDPGREAMTVGASRNYPPGKEQVGRVRPLAGTMVPPEDPNLERGTAILMGFRLDRPGTARFEGVEVDYRVGSKPFTMRAKVGLVICGPPSVHPDCPRELFDNPDA